MINFRFNEEDALTALSLWAERQQKDSPELMEHHIEYMEKSVLAFLFSDEAALLREEEK